MQFRICKILFVVVIFMLTSPYDVFSCGKKMSIKTSCIKNDTSEQKSTSCCKKNKKTCKKDETKSNCSCFCYSFNLFLPTPLALESLVAYLEKKELKFYLTQKNLLAGYHSVWLPPKIV